MSAITKSYKKKMWLFKILSMVLTFGPLIVCTIIGFISATSASKLVLGLTIVISIGMTAVNVLLKYHLRSMIWIMLIGIYSALGDVQTLLIILAICNIVDEVAITPLAKHYKDKFIINKEIDERV